MTRLGFGNGRIKGYFPGFERAWGYDYYLREPGRQKS